MSAKIAHATHVWYRMHTNYQTLVGISTELFSNTLATDEQKLTVANLIGDMRNSLLEARLKIIKDPEYRKPPFTDGITGVKL